MIDPTAMLGLDTNPSLQAIQGINQGIGVLIQLKEQDSKSAEKEFKHQQEMDRRSMRELDFVAENEAAEVLKYERAMKDPQAKGLAALLTGAAMLGAAAALKNFKPGDFIGGAWDKVKDVLGIFGIQMDAQDDLDVEQATDEGSIDEVSSAESGTGSPLPMPAGIQVTSKAGMRGGRPHNGLDVAAPVGTPLTIKGSGKVVSRGNDSGGYGKWIVIKDNRGEHLYAHLQKYGKFKDGASINTGDVVAYTGNTGRSTGPHLHWEFDTRPGKVGIKRSMRDTQKPRSSGYKWTTPFTGKQEGGVVGQTWQNNMFDGKAKPVDKRAKPPYGEKHLITVMDKAGIKDKNERAMFLAQMNHESGGFKYHTELKPKSYYEGNKKLGNTQPGDGKRFLGRGYIQLTGRWNYNHFGKKVGVDLVKNPEKAAETETAGKIAKTFWMDRVDRTAARKGDVPGATKGINHKLNGLADRQKKFKMYQGKGYQRGGVVGLAPQKRQGGGLVQMHMPQTPQPNTEHYTNEFFVRQGRKAVGANIILVNNIVSAGGGSKPVVGSGTPYPTDDSEGISYTDISQTFYRYMRGIKA